MRILKMGFNDLLEVTTLSSQLGYPLSLEDIQRAYEAIQAHPDYGLFVAKLDNGKVVGWIQVNRASRSLILKDVAEVAALVVSDQCRGQGIGKLLLKEAEIWAQKNQLRRVSLSSNVKREDARRFYLREGYQVSKTSNFFFKNLE